VASKPPSGGGEFEQRRGAVGSGLAARRLDALLVSFGPNLRYLSGFTGSNGLLLALVDRAILFTDPRYLIRARQESTCEVRIVAGPLAPAVVSAIARLRLKRIGFEPAHMTCESFEAFRSRLPMGASLEPAGGWIEQLRTIKSPAEIALIRQSVDTNSRAFGQTLKRIRPGMTERDVAAELEYRMRRLGAEKPSFETIVASGVRSALPHAQPGAAPLAAGELVVVDMGVQQEGYASDMTRMLHIGRPSRKVEATYAAVLEAQLAALDAVRAGAATRKIDAAARRVLKSHGLDRAFVHSTGHGLGLEIHESPRLGRGDKSRLAAGMTVTIEPGVYLEGFGGIRIEDTVLVTDRGCEVLTPTPKELFVI
jgi:Xaa-Pro aminopeptidase